MNHERFPVLSRSPELGDFCESPIEQNFYNVFRRYCSAEVHIRPQRWIWLPHARFRLDFALSTDRGCVCVECDGQRYHNPARDEIRDALVLGSGLVTGIFRFPGWALVYAPDDCVFTVSRYFPKLFTRPGLEALEGLANPYVREFVAPPSRFIHCDIRASAAAKFVPEDLGDLERAEVARLRPFEALFRSFDRQADGESDFRNAYHAILLRKFATLEDIQAAYPFPGMAEADFKKLAAVGSPSKREARIRSLRLLDAEYKIQCHPLYRRPEGGTLPPAA